MASLDLGQSRLKTPEGLLGIDIGGAGGLSGAQTLWLAATSFRVPKKSAGKSEK